MRRIISFLMSMCFVLTLVLAVLPTHVSASAMGVPYAKNTGVGLTAEQVKNGAFLAVSLPEKKLEGGKIVKVSSSNKKMITKIEISQVLVYQHSMFNFIVKSYGKTTFTITVRTGKNKLKKYKCNFSAVKYNCPVSSVTLGESENFASEFKNDISLRYNRALESNAEKISIKPKNGWKLTSITHFYYDQKQYRETIKNNSIIEYHENALNEEIYIDLKNKRNGVSQTLVIYISRAPFIYEN